MHKNYQKSFPTGKNAGFTLIELLVVVLIIGILAAIALPQYQVAVEKARLSTVMQNVKTIKNAAELYYLANGKYEDKMELMDISDIAGCQQAGSGQLRCGDKGWYDWKYGLNGNQWAAVGHTQPYGKFRTAFLIYADHNPTTPGEYQCWAKSDDSVALRTCRSLGGIEKGTDKCRPDGANLGSCTIFRLP